MRRNQRFGLPWLSVEILSSGWQCFVLLPRSPSISKVELSALNWMLETNSLFPRDSKGSQAAIYVLVLLPSQTVQTGILMWDTLCIGPQQILRNYSLTHCALGAGLGSEFFNLVSLVRNKSIAACERNIFTKCSPDSYHRHSCDIINKWNFKFGYPMIHLILSNFSSNYRCTQ